jgi:PGF-pre-PGF domain-containing protein
VASQTSSGGTSPGGSAGTTTTTVEVKKVWSKIEPGTAATMSIAKSGIDVSSIELVVKEAVSSVSITVTKLSAAPSSVKSSVSGNAYQYLEIKGSNLDDDNVESAKIRFSVPKTWIDSNGIDKGKVVLNRYADDNWNALATTLLSEDDDSVNYEATVPGFSVFAITGEAVSTQQPEEPQQPEQPEQPEEPGEPQQPAAQPDETPAAPAQDYTLLIIVAIILVVVMLAVVARTYWIK